MNERALATAARLLESEEWQFTTSLGRTQLNVYGTDHDETDAFSLSIRWALLVDLREWGVKSMDVDIKSIQGYGTVTNDNTGEERGVTISWPQGPRPPGHTDEPTPELASYMAEPLWKVKTLIRRRDSDSLAVNPTYADIDLRQRSIEIGFY